MNNETVIIKVSKSKLEKVREILEMENGFEGDNEEIIDFILDNYSLDNMTHQTIHSEI